MTQQINLLQNWNQENLKEVLLTLESGGRPTGGAQKEGIPSIGGEHLNYNGKFNFETMKFIPEDYFKSMNKGIIKEDDVLIVKDGATTGKTSFVDNNFPYEKSAVNEHVFIARANEKISPKYLFYFLYSIEGQDQLKKAITGSAQGGINLSILDKIYVRFPSSLPLQSRIVSAIETQFTGLDDAVKSLKAVKQKIQLYRKAVLKKAFEKGEEVELGKIFEIIMGQSPPSEFYNRNKKGKPFFQGKKEFGNRYPRIEIWTEKYNKEAEKGDLLLSIRAPIGPCNIAPEKCAIGRGIAAIKANNETESLLLFYLVKFNAQRLDSKGTGTTFKAISKTSLNSFLTNIPPKKDWEKIVSEIESSFSVIDKVEEAVDNSLKKTEQLRKSILKVAFEGRLVK